MSMSEMTLAFEILKDADKVMNITMRGLYDALSTLDEREQTIIKLRFMSDLTLDECSSIFHITRERIRQIEAKALRKLRHPSRSKKLKDYLE